LDFKLSNHFTLLLTSKELKDFEMLELNAVSARRSTLNAALADCQANFDNDFRKAEVAHQDIVAVVKLRDNVTALLNQVGWIVFQQPSWLIYVDYSL
jgi:hypothetical protein